MSSCIGRQGTLGTRPIGRELKQAVEDFVKQNDMSIVLQLVQDMSTQMIDFEKKWVTSTSTPDKTSSQADFKNHPNNL